jgi:hypothetical protein
MRERMQDPKWIDPAVSPAPALSSTAAAAAAAAGMPRLTRARHGLYKARTPAELSEDVIRLADQQYDMSGRLFRERDKADEQLLDARSKLRFCKGWIWVLSLAIGGSWAVTALLLKLWLIPILEKVSK